MSFVHLQLHTEYSLLRGMSRMKKAIAKAKELGMTALAITDYGSMYGAFKFYIACKDAGIKPIIGCELYKSSGNHTEKQSGDFKDAYSLVVLAKDLTGYRNLVKLVSYSQLEGLHYQPRVDFELLEKYHEGLIVLSGSPLRSEIGEQILHEQPKRAQELVLRYKQIFGENFYLQLERHPGMAQLEMVNQKLIMLSRKHSIPLVATANTHYMEADDAYAHEVLLCIGSQRVVFEKDRPLTMMEHPDYYFKTDEEMSATFADIPEAVENTARIAEMCNVEIPYGTLILPKYPVPPGMTIDEHFAQLIEERKVRVKEYDQDIVNTRIAYEVDIISKKGYVPYFLFVQDMVNWAKDQGIAVGPGRGSAAGSLVAYILRITDINPLDYNLPFERFLNPDRPTPPDIDIDFADTRREEVVTYIAKRYGEDHVAQIITFGTMEARMVIRDVTRALGHSYATGDRLAKMIPPSKQGFHVTLEIALKESPTLKLAYDNEEEIKQIIDVSKRLESLPRHSSVHAAGLIVGDIPLIEHIPLQLEPNGHKVITQYDMYSLDLNAVSENKAVGLVKVDILGLRNLSIIESALSIVKENRGESIDIHEVKLNDKKAYELISTGRTVGVFQLESAGMRRLAKDLVPNKLTDITAMVALYRPGPMDLIPTFIEGRRNPKSVRYPHKDLKAVLAETYGILVYQEQVIDIAVVMAHFTKAQADLLRMAVGKKKKALMEKGKAQFIQGCVEHGYTEKLAKEVFGFIEKFASYGFNKSHAASYALIAYWTAYVKANFPIEFMTSLMTAEINAATGPLKEVKMTAALEECKAMKIPVLPPDINKSQDGFSVEGEAIRFGLSAIKNVGSAAIETIVDARKEKPFHSFTDFLYRVDLRKVNKKTLESLINVGAFIAFGTRATLITNFPEQVERIGKNKDLSSSGQENLFDSGPLMGEHLDTFEQVPEYPPEYIAQAERELIGFLLTQNPLEPYAEIIAEKINKKVSEITPDDVKKQYIIAGEITFMKLLRTKKDNKEMAICTINDGTGSIDMVVFPKTFQQIKDIIKIHEVLLIKGTVSNREEVLGLLVDNAVSLKEFKHGRR
ncbi:DNA polymerase III subunit alpha [Candidatus Woesebacteria bacterium]|nr:DNA polymerase III subunit alpha [Candidatus Woesebacteria bacterium]